MEFQSIKRHFKTDNPATLFGTDFKGKAKSTLHRLKYFARYHGGGGGGSFQNSNTSLLYKTAFLRLALHHQPAGVYPLLIHLDV